MLEVHATQRVLLYVGEACGVEFGADDEQCRVALLLARSHPRRTAAPRVPLHPMQHKDDI